MKHAPPDNETPETKLAKATAGIGGDGLDVAIQMLIPIGGGLLLGQWLENTYGFSPLWTVGLAVFGLVSGLWIVYKRLMLKTKKKQDD
ncbi:MAG: AtpZ/AtpI family protein [Candidatus Melainabacteria bacterium]